MSASCLNSFVTATPGETAEAGGAAGGDQAGLLTATLSDGATGDGVGSDSHSVTRARASPLHPLTPTARVPFIFSLGPERLGW